MTRQYIAKTEKIPVEKETNMYKLKTIENYKPQLSLRETQKAIKLLKDTFEKTLADALNLERISAPMLVTSASGINDDLNGVERPVKFDIKEVPDYDAEIVQSLAKWKRVALYNYGFKPGEGLYTDMNAVRRDDMVDNIHSVYVDQWDWELIIDRSQRNTEFLKSVVSRIAAAVVDTQNVINKQFKAVTTDLQKKVFSISSQELLDLYPTLSAKERELEITKKKKTVFITQIGGRLSNGQSHDGRAPDYDDWALNGDLLFWNEVMNEPLEISSMGIRVDSGSMLSQLEAAGKNERKSHEYHQGVINNVLPLTIGGGIGQSRLCMLILQKLHIGEVQVSVWPKKMIGECKKAGIPLL